MGRLTSNASFAFTLFVATASAFAVPRIVLKSDPQGREARAAAAEFWNALAEGQGDHARAFFAGSESDAQLIDAYPKLFQATDNLMKALPTNLANRAFPAGQGSASEQARLQAIHPMMFTGDRGWIAGESLFFLGTEVDRIDGQWKVIRLAPTTRRAERLRTRIEKCTAATDKMTAAISGGRTDDVAKVSEDFREAMYSTADNMGVSPECKPLALPATEPYQRANSLSHLLGSPPGSAEVRAFLAGLPGLPLLNDVVDSLFIDSNESGLHLTFRGPKKFPLTSIQLTVTPGESCSYRGEMPQQLLPTDQRRDVERKLGSPTESSGDGKKYGYKAQYPGLGLQINYNEPDLTSPQNTIRDIVLIAPDPTSEPVAPLTTTHRLAFRFVADSQKRSPLGADQLQDPGDHSGKTLLPIEREVQLDESSIAMVFPSVDSKAARNIVALTMTPSGGEKLRKLTTENQSRRLAIVLDGHILMAAAIHGVISDHVQIDVGKYDFDDPASAAVPREIAGKIHAAVFKMAARRPTTQNSQ